MVKISSEAKIVIIASICSVIVFCGVFFLFSFNQNQNVNTEDLAASLYDLAVNPNAVLTEDFDDLLQDPMPLFLILGSAFIMAIFTFLLVLMWLADYYKSRSTSAQSSDDDIMINLREDFPE